MTMTSPVKSLSIREGVDGSLGIYKKIKPGLYSSVADFWFDICVFVKCEGELNSCSGYILDVHKVQGEIRVSKKCFISCREMDSVKKFKNALNNALADCGGLFWEDVKDSQLQALLRKMTQKFFLNGGKRQKAVTVVGRQTVAEDVELHHPENDVYVFNEFVQMNGKGDLIREDEFSYVWLDSYVFCTSNDAKEMLKNEFKVNIPRVINQFSWVEFLDAALPVLNVNFYQSIMMIAGAIACFHYPYSIKMADACPAPTAIGVPGSGKSTTINIISKMLGSKIESQATGEAIQSLLRKTTVPLCWDDPTYPTSVKTVLAGSFDSKGKRTKGRGKELPRTNVVLAVNFELEDDLRSFERIVPVVYKEPESPEDAAQYRLQKEHLLNITDTSCLPWIIKLGAKLMDNKDRVDDQVDFFKKRCPTLLPRIHKLYGLYKAIVHDIIEEYLAESFDHEVKSISHEMYEEFLDETFLPYVRKVILQSTNAVKANSRGLDQFMACLAQCLRCESVPVKDLQKCIKNNVGTRADGSGVMHLILPDILSILKDKLGPQASFSLPNLRKSISELDGTSVNHSGVFGGVQRKCVKIPRRHIDINVVTLIDEAFGDETPEAEEVVERPGTEETGDRLELLQSQVATEMEHNKILRNEKRSLEESLHSESVKRTKMEERIALLEQELAKKERAWKATESELLSNISELQERLKRNDSDPVAVKSLTAAAFTQIVSENLSAKGPMELESNDVGEVQTRELTRRGKGSLNDSGIEEPEFETEHETPQSQAGQSDIIGEEQAKKKKSGEKRFKKSETDKLMDNLHKGICHGRRSCNDQH